MISVVGTGLVPPFDVEPYGPGDSEFSASRRLLRRAVRHLGPRFADSCLSGCFSKPQAVVYGRAAPTVSENLAWVPIIVRHRRGLRKVSGPMPLAGWLRLPAMWEPEVLRNREGTALAMHSLPVSGLPYSGDDFAQHKNASDGLVLGGLPDDH